MPQVGDTIRGETLVVDPARMKTMAALLRDSNPIHFDPVQTARLGLGDRTVNQGPINLGYLTSLLSTWAGSPGRVRRLQVRFLGNVFAGELVRAEAEVTAVHADTVELAVRLVEGTDRVVVAGTAVVSLGAVSEHD